MPIEHKTISVEIFVDQYGEPTCCADHIAGKTCRFLGTRYFGCVSVCMLRGDITLTTKETGFLRPHDDCELWGGNVIRTFHANGYEHDQ